MSDEMTDTQKLRAIPQLKKDMDKLLRLIVGDASLNQPGLLEEIRNIANDVKEIKAEQAASARLEQRIKAIEERHKLIDEEKKRNEKRLDSYKLAVFGMIVSNIGFIIMLALGFIK